MISSHTFQAKLAALALGIAVFGSSALPAFALSVAPIPIAPQTPKQVLAQSMLKMGKTTFANSNHSYSFRFKDQRGYEDIAFSGTVSSQADTTKNFPESSTNMTFLIDSALKQGGEMMRVQARAGVGLIVANKKAYIGLKNFSLDVTTSDAETRDLADAVEESVAKIKGTWLSFDLADIVSDPELAVLDKSNAASRARAYQRLTKFDYLTSITDMGIEKLNGVSTYHYRIVLDTAKLERAINEMVSGTTCGANCYVSPSRKVTFDLWIGTNDYLLYKYVVPQQTFVDGVDTMTINLQGSFSNYNKKVKITAPKKTMSFEKFIDDLLGGAFGESSKETEMRGQDARIKSYLSASRAQAEIYYDINAGYSHASSCSNGMFLAKTTKNSSQWSDFDLQSTVYSLKSLVGSSGVMCGANNQSWAMAARLPSSLNSAPAYWCADSTGKIGEWKGASAPKQGLTACR